MKIEIEIDQQDFGTLCICALRYCHGRQTYMPETVQRIVVEQFDSLSEQDLWIIARDEESQNDMGLWGDECTRVGWEFFYDVLRAYRQDMKAKGANR